MNVENKNILREKLDNYFNQDLSDSEKENLEIDLNSSEEIKNQFEFEKDFIGSLEREHLQELKQVFDKTHKEMEYENNNIPDLEMDSKNLSIELEYNTTELFLNLNKFKSSVQKI